MDHISIKARQKTRFICYDFHAMPEFCDQLSVVLRNRVSVLT